MKQKRNRRSTVRFNLDGDKEGKDLQPMYLIYRYKKDQDGKNVMLKYAVGKKIYRKNWDQGIQRVKPGVNFPVPDAELINTLIRKLENACLNIVRQNRGIPVNEFKDELDYLLGIKDRPKAKTDFTLLDYAWKYIRKSQKYPRTIQKYI